MTWILQIIRYYKYMKEKNTYYFWEVLGALFTYSNVPQPQCVYFLFLHRDVYTLIIIRP